MNGWRRKDWEQLNVLLGVIAGEETAERMANDLARRFGSLSVLLEAARSDQDIVGVSERAQQLLSLVPELARRRRLEEFGPNPLLDTRAKAAEFVKTLYIGTGYEMPLILCLDEELRLMRYRVLNEGSHTEVQFRPRMVVQEAMRSGASAVILCHNHPSGRAFFSEADVSVTEKARTMFGLIGLSLVDHLLVAGEKVVGMRGQRFVNERDWQRSGRLIPMLGKWIR